MRARINRVLHQVPTVQAQLTLREAYALGTVLAGTEGEEMRARRVREVGRQLLTAGIAVSLPAAEEIAAAAEAGADPATASGRLALAIAGALRQACGPEGTAGNAALGRWVETQGHGQDGQDGQKRTETDA